VGNPCENGGLTVEQRMSFSLWPWLGKASEKASTRFENVPEPGGMQSLHSTDGSVFRLHSCRALSAKPATNLCRSDLAVKGVSGLSMKPISCGAMSFQPGALPVRLSDQTALSIARSLPGRRVGSWKTRIGNLSLYLAICE
jgi:hypothetical protein